MQLDLFQILLHSLYAIVAFSAVTSIGLLLSWFLRINNTTGNYSFLFHAFIIGLLIVVAGYSTLFTHGFTINILIWPLLVWYMLSSARSANRALPAIPFGEVIFIIVLSVVLIHLFPESEYKQNDSFFYLKIAESLSVTGQENFNHYYNNFSSQFHGTEPYHYFELWWGAMLVHATGSFHISIDVFRFVSYAVIITGAVIGLYALVGQFLHLKIRYSHKFFCWSLLLFSPDLVEWLPVLGKITAGVFEGNIIERPNFRIIYLFIIGYLLVSSQIKQVPFQRVFWLLLLSIISFKCTVVIIPAWMIFAFFNLVVLKKKEYAVDLLASFLFAIAFALFYYTTKNNGLPSLYTTSVFELVNDTVRYWRFILFSIATSVLYIIAIALGYWLAIYLFNRQKHSVIPLLKQHAGLIFLLVTGIVLGRVLLLKDNGYQFLFFSQIIASLLIWFIAVSLLKRAGATIWIVASIIFSSFFITRQVLRGERENVFRQNGQFIYEGKKYSAAYLDSVVHTVKSLPQKKGAYLADTDFYSETYYSRRNPNVYFLPSTYILAGQINNNIELCISDSAALMVGVHGNRSNADYLQNAINRSIFFQHQLTDSSLTLADQRWHFIQRYQLKYILATKGVQIDFIPQDAVKKLFRDPITGEQFIALK